MFLIEWETIYKKNGKTTLEVVLGITSRTPEQASTQHILKVNRGCIRTGHGPENVTRLRRFACGVIQLISKKKSNISQKMQQLNRDTRLVFDYLRMTSNSTRNRSL